MKKFFSLVLALVMALSLTTVAWAADVTVTNSTELQAAVNDSANAGKTIKLTASANSYKVTLTSASADNLTIEGVDGAVMSYLEAAVGYEGTFTVKNCTFDVPATTWCYACLQGKYNVTFDTCTFKAGNMDSAIYVENGYDDAVFTLKNCTFYGTYVETPVVLSNSTSHTFAVTATGNTFVGNDGGLGVYAKDSTMTLTTDEENITHLAQSEAAIHAAVAVADAGDTIKLRKNRSNSPMTLATLPVLSKPITIDANDVTLANFPEGENITTNANGEIIGGTFDTDVRAYLADGLIQSANGSVVAVPSAGIIPSGGPTLVEGSIENIYDPTYASWTAEISAKRAEDVKDSEFATYTIKMIAKVDDAPIWWDGGVEKKGEDVDFKAGDEKEFVKVSAAGAWFTLVDGNDITYLAPAEIYNDDAFFGGWDELADEVTLPVLPDAEADMECATLYAWSAAAATFYEFDNTLYREFDDTKDNTKDMVIFNVDGVAVEVVKAKMGDATRIDGDAKATFDNLGKTFAQGDYLYSAHNYVVERKNDSYKNGDVTKVYCDLCKNSFTFVESADVSAAVKAFKAGNYFGLETKDGKTVYLAIDETSGATTPAGSSRPSTGTTTKPSTDKNVTSADTFDAGIAMYVGMSVLAATGSAVVIGKKKD